MIQASEAELTIKQWPTMYLLLIKYVLTALVRTVYIPKVFVLNEREICVLEMRCALLYRMTKQCRSHATHNV